MSYIIHLCNTLLGLFWLFCVELLKCAYVLVHLLVHVVISAHLMCIYACKPGNVCAFVYTQNPPTICLTLTCSRWQARSDGDGHFPGRYGHTMRDRFCEAVTRHYQTAHSAPNTPQAHEDDHIWYTDDILSLLWQHGLIFLLWHPLPCGCYSSQIYHFNGEVVRPEDYLRDKYIIVCSFGIDWMSFCPD